MRPLDPRARLALLLAAGLLAVSLERPAGLLLLAVLSGLPLLAARIERRHLWRGALLLASVVWATALSQGIFYDREPRVALVQLGPLTVWREGLAWGAVQSLRVVAVGLAGLSVALTTPPGRLMAALQALRVPFGLAFMATTALRFLPETANEIATVRAARRLRGRPAHRRAPWAWLALEVGALRPVVARTLRRARALAESLDARGFDPAVPREPLDPLRLGPLDALLAGSALAVGLAALALRVLFALYAAEVAYLPRLRPLYGFVREWM